VCELVSSIFKVEKQPRHLLYAGFLLGCFFDPEDREDRLCGLVDRVTAYRSRGPGSIPGATRFSEK
jgi:hypothetical protein